MVKKYYGILLSLILALRISFGDDDVYSKIYFKNSKETETGKSVVFRYNVDGNSDIESSTLSFCKENEVQLESCELLFKESLRQLILGSKIHQSLLAVPNQHLNRDFSSTNSEILNRFRANYALAFNEITDRISSEELHYNKKLRDIFTQIISLKKSYYRVAFIHSCSLEHKPNDIVQGFLRLMVTSGLLLELDAVFIYDFGLENIPLQSYIFKLNKNSGIYSNQNTMNNKLHYYHRSEDISQFEIPTIRMVHYFSRLSVFHGVQDVQLLYLHTKGASYSADYQQIIDWRDMMMYFLVERHETCRELLLSGEFDVLGSNYACNYRHVSGNFWWASSEYIARLNVLSSFAEKYDAEKWILGSVESYHYQQNNNNNSGDSSSLSDNHRKNSNDSITSSNNNDNNNSVRLYELHNPCLDHSVYHYPRARYAFDYLLHPQSYPSNDDDRDSNGSHSASSSSGGSSRISRRSYGSQVVLDPFCHSSFNEENGIDNEGKNNLWVKSCGCQQVTYCTGHNLF